MTDTPARHLALCCLATTLVSGMLLVAPSPAWAVQGHGGNEGLISHEIGHILFISGILFLLFRLRRQQLKAPGWPQFHIFLWLLLGWNLLTFSGHWLDKLVPPAKFRYLGATLVGYQLSGFGDFFFYLTRLDHLLLVPALFFLFLALRTWSRQ